jgi:hypothetical protein
MRKYTLAFVLFFVLFLPINTLIVISIESTETVTIDIIHHDPQDLIVTIGYLKATNGITTISRENYVETRTVWNKEKSEVEDGIYKTWKLNDLGFKNILKPDFNIIWFIEIEDVGIRHLKENLTKKEQDETGNFIKLFYLTINGLTYRSYQHPFIDDGCTVRAEIYGSIAEENLEGGTRAITFSRVLCVSSIGEFVHYSDLNPQQAIDSINLIMRFRDLAADNYINWYDEFFIIDGDDPEEEWDDDFKTHSKIYVSTVTSLLNNIDACTDDSSRIVCMLTSHGKSSPTAMCTYDTWWGWGVYTPSMLASELEDMTNEGTDIFCWAKFCYSYKFTALKESSYHHNHLISWVYEKYSSTGSKLVEYRVFEERVRYYGEEQIEVIFTEVASAFHAVHSEHEMKQWDYKSGSFWL